MSGTNAAADAHYAALAARFIARPCVARSESKGFGAGALTWGGRIFAALTRRKRLVVKLKKSRVDWLVAAEIGERFEPNPGRPMQEWLLIAPGHETEWQKLAEEALAFAQAGASSSKARTARSVSRAAGRAAASGARRRRDE